MAMRMKLSFGGERIGCAGDYDDRYMCGIDPAVEKDEASVTMWLVNHTHPNGVEQVKPVEVFNGAADLARAMCTPEIAEMQRRLDEAHKKTMRDIYKAFGAGAQRVELMDKRPDADSAPRPSAHFYHISDWEMYMPWSMASVDKDMAASRQQPLPVLEADMKATEALLSSDDRRPDADGDVIDYRQLLPAMRVTEYKTLADLTASLAELLPQETVKPSAPVRRVASHAFGLDGTCGNVLASGPRMGRRCGRRFSDISSATREDLYKDGVACHGTLTPHELDEIEAERDRIWAAVQGG